MTWWIWLAVAFVLFLLLRRAQQPRAGTRRLAMTVWSAFGPYANAEEAADGLRRACRAALSGTEDANERSWIEGHISNFAEAETKGRFKRTEAVMRTGLRLTAYGAAFDRACERVRADALDQAQGALDQLRTQTGLGGVLAPGQDAIDRERKRSDEKR